MIFNESAHRPIWSIGGNICLSVPFACFFLEMSSSAKYAFWRDFTCFEEVFFCQVGLQDSSEVLWLPAAAAR